MKDMPRLGKAPKEPKPVENIEVSTSHTKLKIVLLVVFLLLAVASFTIGIISCLSAEEGWSKVEASSGSDCSDEFVFYYYLDEGGMSGRTELKDVSALYSTACYEAYRIFNSHETFSGYSNLASVNLAPNTEVTVDPALYAALTKLIEAGDRSIYLAPIYTRYYALFYASDDGVAADCYPVSPDSDIAKFYAAASSFASDPDSVDLVLGGNNRVTLSVSEEYSAFAEENGVTSYVDLFTLKNAFIADYLAGELTSHGYKTGIISSRDGFMRCLINSGISSSLPFFDLDEGKVNRVADLGFTGSVAAARFRDFPIGNSDYGLYYTFADGTTVSGYVGSDGLCRAATHDLVAYSYDMDCASVALAALPVYVADVLDKDKLSGLKDGGVYTAYCEERTLYYNDGKLIINNLLHSGGTVYTAVCTAAGEN